MVSAEEYHDALLAQGHTPETALHHTQQNFPGIQIGQAPTLPQNQPKSRDLSFSSATAAEPDQMAGVVSTATMTTAGFVPPATATDAQVVGIPMQAGATQSPYGVMTQGGLVVGQVIPFNFKEALFSFEGRMRRLHFGLISMVAWFVIVAAVAVFFISIMGMEANPDEDAMFGMALGLGSGGALCLLAIPALWISLATQIKRLHDLEKPGTWVLIGILGGMIPFLGGFISLGFFLWLVFADGTPGHNQFGPDPKGRFGAPPVTVVGQPF